MIVTSSGTLIREALRAFATAVRKMWDVVKAFFEEFERENAQSRRAIEAKKHHQYPI